MSKRVNREVGELAGSSIKRGQMEEASLNQPRRSKRLMIAKGVSKKIEYEMEPTSPIGLFDTIPIEMRHEIFSYLNLKELGVVSLCSKEMRNAVTEFHSSSSNFLRYFPKVQNVATKTDKKKMMKEFWVVGIFVKRLTCLYPTKERMRLFVNYVRKVETSLRINAAVTGGSDCVCQTLVCYGTLIHAFIAGWEESECLYVHQVLEQISRMNTNTLSILESLYGNNEAMEMYARRYYNLVYIRPGRTCREQAFWISRVLKDKPIVYQAKLVFIIFGPIDQSDRVYWEAVTNEDLVYDHQSYLTDLASLFNLLQKCSQEWTNDDVLSLFEDLTETPAAWLKENVANLLLLCGNPLDKLYIENKLANGKQKELAELFVYMVLVCSRHDNCVRKVVDHFENIYHSTRSRRLQSTLLQAIALAHEELTIKLLESALDSPNEMVNETRKNDFINYTKAWRLYHNMIHDVMFYTDNRNLEE